MEAVVHALDRLGVAYEEMECDPEFADTAAFCERYGVDPIDRRLLDAVLLTSVTLPTAETPSGIGTNELAQARELAVDALGTEPPSALAAEAADRAGQARDLPGSEVSSMAAELADAAKRGTE